MRRRRLRAVARGGALACAALLASELGLRLAAFGWSPRVLRAWRETPSWSAIRRLDGGAPSPVRGGHARWALQPGGEPVDYRLDERGFRVAAAGAATAPATCTVIVAGDSNAFGYGVAAAAALPARLTHVLAEAGRDAAVANAGVCGSNVVAQRRWLDDVLARERPDVVLLVESPWSLRTDDPPDGRDATLGDRTWNLVERRLRGWSAASAVVDRAVRLAGHAAQRLVGWPPAGGVAWELEPLREDDAAFARRLTEVSRELAGIVASIRRRGARPVLAFVPLDVQVSRARNRLYADERLPYRAFGFEDRDYTQLARYDALGAVAEDLKLPFVDATTRLRALGGHGYLPDDYHLSPLGHAVVASAVGRAVAEACAAARAPGTELVASARGATP